MNYTLSFQQQWPPQQLVRSGGEHDPLRRELRTVTVAQYKNAMVNQGKKTPKKYDFRLDENGDIIPEWSTGKRDKIPSIRLLPMFVDELIADNVGINVYNLFKPHRWLSWLSIVLSCGRS